MLMVKIMDYEPIGVGGTIGTAGAAVGSCLGELSSITWLHLNVP